LFILALAKTVTPRGVPRGSGAGRLVFARRLLPQSRAEKAPTGFGVPVWRTGAQKPAEANDIYRPVSCRALYYSYWFSLKINGTRDGLEGSSRKQ